MALPDAGQGPGTFTDQGKFMKKKLWVGVGVVAVLAVAVVLGLRSIGMFATQSVHVANGAAIGGYDAVAYFTDQKPVKGSPEFAEEWNGARWLFASAEHRDLFRAAPEQYAPQFGGYCAYAVSHNYTAKTDPEAWSVVDGKLYLNYDLDTRTEWLAEREQFIADGQRNWPKVLW